MRALDINTRKKYKVFFDPLRQEIIKTMQQLGRPVTVKGIADIINVAHSKVHYHVQKLLELNAVEIDYTEEINGIIAKYYVIAFDEVNILSQEGSKIDKSILADETLNALKLNHSKNFDELVDAYNETLRRMDTDETCFGVHHLSQEIYLSFEERHELRKIVAKYLSDHAKKPKSLEGTTKTKVFFEMFDIDIHDK